MWIFLPVPSRVCVHLSVRPSRSCILSKRVNISSKFFTNGSPHHSFFLYQTYGNIPTGTPHTGALTAGGVGKNRNSRKISDSIACCVVRLPSAITAVPNGGKLVTVAGKRRCLFFTGDDDEVFMTRIHNVTPKTTEQHLIVRIGKSEAEVTIIKDCDRGTVLLTVLLKLTTDRHEASRGLSTTTELLVLFWGR